MKKCITLIILSILFSINISSQIIIGGNIGLEGTLPMETKDCEIGIESKTDNVLGLSLTPRIGYLMLEDKLEAGAALGLSYNAKTSYITSYQLINDNLRNGQAFKDKRIESISFAFSPYVRYKAFQFNKFSIYFEGVTTFGLSKDLGYTYFPFPQGYNQDYLPMERTKEEANALNNIERQLQSTSFTYGLMIKPILAKDVTEHLRLETGLNFMCLGISGTIKNTRATKDSQDPSHGYTMRQSHTMQYSIGVWNGNVINIGILTIGATYKF